MPNDGFPDCSLAIRQQEQLRGVAGGRWAGGNGNSAAGHGIQSPADQGDLCECRRTNPNGLQSKCFYCKTLESIELTGSTTNKAKFATFRGEGYEWRSH